MVNFPSSTPSFAGFSPSNTLSQDNHGAQHNLEQGEIVALANKIGTGTSTPTSGMLLRGSGVGTSVWAQANLTTDVTGVLPQANGGTGTTLATGTGKVVYDASPTIVSPTLTTPIIADFTNSNHDHSTTVKGGSIANAALPVGTLVQMVNTLSSAVATGTTVMPSDDTPPQNTEGDQYMTLSIIPKSITNTLIIDIIAMLANSTVQILSGALFQDSNVSAIAAGQTTAYLTSAPNMFILRYTMAAGTVSSTTFNFRAGTQGTGTLTFNGLSGGRIFGTTPKSSITVWEYKS